MNKNDPGEDFGALLEEFEGKGKQGLARPAAAPRLVTSCGVGC